MTAELLSSNILFDDGFYLSEGVAAMKSEVPSYLGNDVLPLIEH